MNTVAKGSTHKKNGLIQMPKHVGISLASAALLSMALIGVVSAEGDVLPDFKKRLYVNGGIGITHVEPYSPSDSLVVSDDGDVGAHLAVGYDINRFLSIEGYVADLGTSEIAFLGTDVGSIDYQVFGLSALGYLFNSKRGIPFGDSDIDGLFRREGLSLYGRAGVGKLSNSSKGVEYLQDHPIHAAFGLGLEYGFKNGFAVRTELMAMDTDATYLNVGLLKRFGKSSLPAVLAVPAVIIPEPAPMKVAVAAPAAPESPTYEPYVAPQGNFDFDRSNISPEFARNLDSLAAVLINNDIGIYISGHTDWDGSEQYNMGLSERRAASVEKYLQNLGVDAQLLGTRGYGESRPVADNTTVKGRAMNRRVEIEIQP